MAGDSSFASTKLRLTATGDVPASPKGICTAIRLVGGSTAATAVIREGGSGGTIITTLKAGIDGVDNHSHDFYYEGGLHLTLTGTGVEATVYIK